MMAAVEPARRQRVAEAEPEIRRSYEALVQEDAGRPLLHRSHAVQYFRQGQLTALGRRSTPPARFTPSVQEPSICRMPFEQYRDFPRTCPGGGTEPPVSTSHSIFDTSSTVHLRSPLSTRLPGSSSRLFATFTTVDFWDTAACGGLGSAT